MVPSGKKPPEPREMTHLESDEEIRQALEERRARLAGKQALAKVPPPLRGQGAAQPALAETQPERPEQRPSMALLCICDDGKLDGEWVRLRADRCVIGRMEGDVRIPHDGLMSSRHAELVRQQTPAGSRWALMDLGSTNGSFVRVGNTLLRHGNEILIGTGHYRFEAAAGSAESGPVAALPPTATTQPWLSQPVRSLVPSLVELLPAGPAQRFSLALPEYWIGRDPTACSIIRPEDLLANPRHARLFRDARGQWHIENNKSLNGLWLRIVQMPLDAACQFRLGEQRFLFRLL